jgi:ABC-type antimicrobial peptide transport system permease subunit
VLQGSVLVTTFCVLAGVGLAAGVVPARLAAKVDPSAALRAH